MFRVLNFLEDLFIARQIRERDRTDTGERMTLEELVKAQSYDLEEFGLSDKMEK